MYRYIYIKGKLILLEKTKKNFAKMHVKGTKLFLKKKKKKGEKRPEADIKIFLKKKTKHQYHHDRFSIWETIV